MRVRRELTKENILDKINSYDIFKKYVSNFKELGKLFCSELRRDNNPTCVITKIGNSLKYRDFSESGYLDCFEYIKVKYGVNFIEALQMINLDFNLNLMPGKKLEYIPTPSIIHNLDEDTIVRTPTEIKIQRRNWEKRDKKYWFNKYNISRKELDFYKVFPLQGFWINNTYWYCDKLAYGYYFGQLLDGRQAWKIYQPYNQQFKWFTNCGPDIYQGFNQLSDKGDTLIITKSCKDVIMLYKIGYNAIAPQSEATLIKQNDYEKLSNRFSNIVILFDNDSAGVEGAKKLSEAFNIPYFILPQGTKDCSDYVEKYSSEQLLNYIEKCLQNIKSLSLNGKVSM